MVLVTVHQKPSRQVAWVGTGCSKLRQVLILTDREINSEVNLTRYLISRSQAQYRFWTDSTLVSKFVQLAMNGCEGTEDISLVSDFTGGQHVHFQ